MRSYVWLFMLLLIFAGTRAPVGAQTFEPVFCHNAEGAYYRPNVFPQFTNAANQLVLRDWSTGSVVMILAESLPRTYSFQWSPNCRYLIGFTTRYSDSSDGLSIWDTVDNRQMVFRDFPVDGRGLSLPHVYWRPDSEAAVFTAWYEICWHAIPPQFIWYAADNRIVPLQPSEKYYSYSIDQVVWDVTRGWIWVPTYGGVAAVDMNTGIEQLSFANQHLPNPHARDSVSARSHLMLSPDGSSIIAYGNESHCGYFAPAMTIYDIASGIATQINVEDNAAGVVAISPDNRYLVMGYTAVRVWDLQNLPSDPVDRLPTTRIPICADCRINSLIFTDASTLQVDGGGAVTRWNIVTGERLP